MAATATAPITITITRGGGVDLTNEDVADILALLDSLPYDALDLRTDRFRLTLRRTPGSGWTEESELLTQPTDVTPEAGKSAGAVGSGASTSSAEAGRSGSAAQSGGATGGTARPDEVLGADGAALGAGGNADGLVAVIAPLPGTFYRAPRPGAPPFVEVGDAVGADTVVAIIETMKLMNSVHAGAPGRVARISVDNGEFAPLGATLLLIEPDSRTPIDPDS
jgi:acetyl-CoA carboxylase biotin carboxyl carrier protein